MNIKSMPSKVAKHYSNTKVGDYPLRLVINSKVNRVAARSLESFSPSWQANFIFDLTDFLILVEQFHGLLKSCNASLLSSHIQWTNELISFAEEVKTGFLIDSEIILERRNIEDDWPAQLQGLINEPLREVLIKDYDELGNALNVMVNFWIQQIKSVCSDLLNKLLEPYSSRELDSRFGLIVDKKHAPKPLPI